MKRIALLATLLLAACAPKTDLKTGPYSVRMVRSEIKRAPEATYLDGQEGNYKWNYTTGLELRSFLAVSRTYDIPEFDAYVRAWYDGVLDQSGNIGGKYDLQKYNLDHICPARTLIGLYRHAWDESKQMFWADPVTGQSAHCWGRALGWYTMALVEVLPFFPENHPGKAELQGILEGILATLPKYADPETGMWYQVLDSPGREGNYLEATCSAMFTYAYLRSAREGYAVPASVDPKALYEALVKKFIREDKDGTLNLTDCCAVAGLGGKENRSGTFEYYINEKIIENDPKGVGPFIWASLEYEKL